jgi:hypothetical protein
MATKRTQTVAVEWWDCGNPDHKHRTREVAERCEARRERGESKFQPRSKEDRVRRIILAMQSRYDGCTFKAVGETLGVSAGTAKQIIWRGLRMSNYERLRYGNPNRHPLPDGADAPGSDFLLDAIRFCKSSKPIPLSERVINVLRIERLESVDQIREAVETRREDLLKVPNLGKKSLREIEEWLSGDPKDSDLKPF